MVHIRESRCEQWNISVTKTELMSERMGNLDLVRQVSRVVVPVSREL